MPDPIRAKRLVKRLRLSEISLVDEGDDPGAHVVIVKSAHPGDRARAGLEAVREDINGGYAMTDLEKRLAEIEGELTTLEKRATDAEALVVVEKARADKAEGERDEAIEKAKAAAPADAEGDIFKGLSPALKERFEAAERRAEAAEVTLEKAREDRERDADIIKAKALGLGEAEGDLIHRVRKGKTTAEDADKIEAILKQAAVGTSTLFKALGSGSTVGGDEEAQLDAKAKDIAKAKNISYAVAYAEALDANPGLYGAIMEKRRARPQG